MERVTGLEVCMDDVPAAAMAGLVLRLLYYGRRTLLGWDYHIRAVVIGVVLLSTES